MSDLTPIELIMGNLLETLRAIPGIRGVVDGAPREYDQREPFNDKHVPFLFCWEGEEVPTDLFQTGEAMLSFPVEIEAVFKYVPGDNRQGLRPEGRRIKGLIQRTVMADPGRGRNTEFARGNAFDTSYLGGAVGRLTEHAGYGGVHLSYAITYWASIKDPRQLRASAA